MNPDQLAELIGQKKWVAVVAIAIALIVRLLKSDTTIPIDIPPRLRVWLALGLGAASGAIDKLVEAGDTTWTTALVSGLSAAAVAILSHNIVIGSVRDGKEFVVPGLTKENTPPGPGKPPSISPPPLPAIITPITSSSDNRKGSLMTKSKWKFGLAALLLVGCSLFTPQGEAKGALVAGDIACVIEKAYLDNDALNAACKLLTPAQQEAARQLLAAHRAGVAKAVATQKAMACAPLGDAGAEGGSK